jgi:hypothetical protein
VDVFEVLPIPSRAELFTASILGVLANWFITRWLLRVWERERVVPLESRATEADYVGSAIPGRGGDQ